jgi:hypothetical protein
MLARRSARHDMRMATRANPSESSIMGSVPGEGDITEQ